MAYHDALFQLGMDLTRSSTAQKEDPGVAVRVAATSKPQAVASAGFDSKTERSSARRVGNHLLVDITSVGGLSDISRIEKTLRRAVEAAGASLLHVHLHRTTPHGGVAGVAVLPGSLFSVHTHPDSGYAAFDILLPAGVKAEPVLAALRESFGEGDMSVRPVRRGSAVAARPRATSASRARVSKAA